MSVENLQILFGGSVSDDNYHPRCSKFYCLLVYMHIASGQNFRAVRQTGTKLWTFACSRFSHVYFIAFGVNDCLFVRMIEYEVFLVFETEHRYVWIITQQLISNCVRT